MSTTHLPTPSKTWSTPPVVALRAQMRAVWRTPGPWVVVGLAALFVALAAFVLPALSELGDPILSDVAAQRELFAADELTAVFAIVLGGVIGSIDHRHGTIVALLLANPKRGRLGAARVLTTAIGGVALHLVASAAGAAAAVVGINSAGGELVVPLTTLLVQLGIGTAGAAAIALLGYGMGEVTRSMAVAVAAPLVLAFLVGPLVANISPAVYELMPSVVPGFLNGNETTDAGMVAVIAATVFYAVVPAALGVATLKRRDIG